MVDPAEDKTHIEENLDSDLSHRLDVATEDDSLMPVEGIATVTSIEGRPSERQVSEVELPGDRGPTRDSTDAHGSTSIGSPDAAPVRHSKLSTCTPCPALSIWPCLDIVCNVSL